MKNIYLNLQVTDDADVEKILDEIVEIDNTVEVFQLVQDKALVLATGDPFDGMSIHGPFTDADEALEYADSNTQEGGGIQVLITLPE